VPPVHWDIIDGSWVKKYWIMRLRVLIREIDIKKLEQAFK